MRDATEDPELASLLSSSALAADTFVRWLLHRCRGIWVYLRYVLDELRLGLRPIDDIGQLPGDLAGYYTECLVPDDDPDWRPLKLPLLATLAAAAEPLSVEVLARLAGIGDLHHVHLLCTRRLRPFLTPSDEEGSRRYSIYHASLREFLAGVGWPSLMDGDGARREELAQAVIDAHSRIAGEYLAFFGGLSTGLRELARDPSAGETDNGYAARYLTYHLREAGREGDLYRLLVAGYSGENGREVNVWYSFHDYSGRVADYLADLDLASAVSLSATDSAIGRHQCAPTLGAEIRYSLMAASVAGERAQVPLDLLKQLVQQGVWSAERAVDHTLSLVDPGDRASALVAIYPHLALPSRSDVMREALEAAAVAGSPSCASTLIALAPHLVPDQMHDALRFAGRITDGYYCAQALLRLAEYLPSELQSEALDVADSIADTVEQVRALAGLSIHWPEDQRTSLVVRASSAALAVSDDYKRAKALALLVPYLLPEQKPDMVAHALNTAISLPDGHLIADYIADLAPFLSADLLSKALAVSTRLSDYRHRARALTALAPHLPGDQQPSVWQRVLNAAEWGNDQNRALILANLAPLLPSDRRTQLFAQALDAACSVRDVRTRAALILQLARKLPTELVARALDATTTFAADDQLRTAVLTEVSRYLSPERGVSELSHALAAARSMRNCAVRSRALSRLAPRLPPGVRAEVLREALAALNGAGRAGSRSDSPAHASALTSLARYLPADQQADVFSEALSRAGDVWDRHDLAQAFADLAAILPQDLLHQALFEASRISDEERRAWALTAVTINLPSEQRAAAAAQAIEAIAAIRSEGDRAGLLAAVAPFVADKQRVTMLAQAVADAAAAGSAVGEEVALRVVGRVLTPGELHQVVTSAATARHDRIELITGLARDLPWALPEDLAAEALTAAIADPYGFSRSRALAVLAPHVPAHQLPDALEAALSISENAYRAGALAALSVRLPAEEQAALVAQAFSDVSDAVNDESRFHSLVDLAPHLKPEQLTHVLSVVTSQSEDYLCAWALVSLAPHLTDALLMQAVSIAEAIPATGQRTRALTGLAPYLPPDKKLLVLSQILTAIAHFDGFGRSHQLQDLAPELTPDLLPEALAAAVAIPDSMDRDRALAALAPHLPPELLETAMESASAPSVIGAILRAAAEPGIGNRKSLAIRLFRKKIHRIKRETLLLIITEFSSMLAEMGGADAAGECVQAIKDAYGWWP